MFSKTPLPAFAAALVAGVTLTATTTAAHAQGTKCLPRAILVEDLKKKYNEQLSGGGLQNPQQLLEVWTSPNSGSFTVFITRADGLACIMATGKHWNSNSEIAPAGVKS